ncbi:MAG TPA: hypothetical protein VD735_06310 [Candidatus Saccharimonadales bacterium]|nr:hypothetical protein [Candidatus Saccharimonadales bacterium]
MIQGSPEFRSAVTAIINEADALMQACGTVTPVADDAGQRIFSQAYVGETSVETIQVLSTGAEPLDADCPRVRVSYASGLGDAGEDGQYAFATVSQHHRVHMSDSSVPGGLRYNEHGTGYAPHEVTHSRYDADFVPERDLFGIEDAQRVLRAAAALIQLARTASQ